jgi:hypothetical protein
MAIQTIVLDPNAVAYTDDEIVAKVNAASTQITRVSAIDSAALEDGAAKANLDAMADLSRGYVKTAPAVGDFRVVSCSVRAAGNKLEVDFDNTPEP